MLNLCIAAACKLQMVNSMMSDFGAISLFFYLSPVRSQVLEEVISKVCPDAQHKVILNVCRTRWIGRLDALDSFVDLFSAKTLGYTRGLTVKLQSSTTDLIQASEEVSLLHQTIKFIRSHMDTYFDQWYGKALELANEIEVAEKIKRRCSTQIYRENYVSDGPKEYYKRALAIPFLDHIIQQLEIRFTSLTIFSGFGIMPNYIFSDEGKMEELADEPNWKVKVKEFVRLFASDIPAQSNIYAQLDMWEIFWRNYQGALPTDITSLIKSTSRQTFPSIHEVLRILATIPVTSCTCERSISGLRRLQTWMRNTMSEERLSSLAVIMFNRSITVNSDEIIDEFAARNKRRMAFSNTLAD
ncbi:52 kDa repressor of the inhibitor of the protein kinase-like [Hydractinia symbiolongicarpus]|uniref:52 kDa repressor of the inhibitor of the protein kinase-like n=1 Tax=Hydractinia symbiolongicarpus TaxID=13093 RepID=UPI002550BB6A|nr:52 kDa repressor of the inhibitor of the protein kinase-like [Hydractinia symbiolongicarpus]